MSKKQEKQSADDVTSAESAENIQDESLDDGSVEIEVKHQDAENLSPDESASASGSTDNDQDDEYQTELEKSTLLLEDARAKADQHWDQVLRLQADMENLRRRNERELEKAHKYALDQFAEELLPVVDSLEMGLEAVVDQDAEVEKLIEGTEMTLNLLKSSLQKFGITELNPISEAFNPEFHQAMTMQESDKVSPNTILAVFQKGYKMHDRLIRPARVVVAKAPVDITPESDPKDDDAIDSTAEVVSNVEAGVGIDSPESLGTQIDEKA